MTHKWNENRIYYFLTETSLADSCWRGMWFLRWPREFKWCWRSCWHQTRRARAAAETNNRKVQTQYAPPISCLQLYIDKFRVMGGFTASQWTHRGRIWTQIRSDLNSTRWAISNGWHTLLLIPNTNFIVGLVWTQCIHMYTCGQCFSQEWHCLCIVKGDPDLLIHVSLWRWNS